MKKEFSEPVVVVLRIEKNDIICTSGKSCGSGGDETKVSGLLGWFGW